MDNLTKQLEANTCALCGLPAHRKIQSADDEQITPQVVGQRGKSQSLHFGIRLQRHDTCLAGCDAWPEKTSIEFFQRAMELADNYNLKISVKVTPVGTSLCTVILLYCPLHWSWYQYKKKFHPDDVPQHQ